MPIEMYPGQFREDALANAWRHFDDTRDRLHSQRVQRARYRALVEAITKIETQEEIEQ